MRPILILLIATLSFSAHAQITNQWALTSAGGHQGQIGNYYFEYSLGEVFTATGQSPSLLNTTGIIQPALNEGALPVTLVSFKAALTTENNVDLTWVTSEEINFDRFEVQRSADGKTWDSLGTIKAVGSETHNFTHYDFVDYAPMGGANIYRLKMIDDDGTFAFSRVVLVNAKENAIITFYPNPAAEVIHFKSHVWTQIESVEIVNGTGQVVKRLAAGSDHQIGVSNLVPGLYLVKAVSRGGRTQTNKVVIIH